MSDSGYRNDGTISTTTSAALYVAPHRVHYRSLAQRSAAVVEMPLNGLRLGRRTCDQAVVGSIPGRASIKLPRSTQPGATKNAGMENAGPNS